MCCVRARALSFDPVTQKYLVMSSRVNAQNSMQKEIDIEIAERPGSARYTYTVFYVEIEIFIAQIPGF